MGSITPMVNEIRIHAGMDVFSDPASLPRECLKRGIVPQAYSPLGSGNSSILHANLTQAIGRAHNVSSAQVALRWLQEHNVPSITQVSAKHPEYMQEDVGIFDWKLHPDEIAMLDAASFANDDPVKEMCILKSDQNVPVYL